MSYAEDYLHILKTKISHYQKKIDDLAGKVSEADLERAKRELDRIMVYSQIWDTDVPRDSYIRTIVHPEVNDISDRLDIFFNVFGGEQPRPETSISYSTKADSVKVKVNFENKESDFRAAKIDSEEDPLGWVDKFANPRVLPAKVEIPESLKEAVLKSPVGDEDEEEFPRYDPGIVIGGNQLRSWEDKKNTYVWLGFIVRDKRKDGDKYCKFRAYLSPTFYNSELDECDKSISITHTVAIGMGFSDKEMWNISRLAKHEPEDGADKLIIDPNEEGLYGKHGDLAWFDIVVDLPVIEKTEE